MSRLLTDTDTGTVTAMLVYQMFYSVYVRSVNARYLKITTNPN